MITQFNFPVVEKGIPVSRVIRWGKRRYEDWRKFLLTLEVSDSFTTIVPPNQLYPLAAKMKLQLKARYIMHGKFRFWRIK